MDDEAGAKRDPARRIGVGLVSGVRVIVHDVACNRCGAKLELELPAEVQTPADVIEALERGAEPHMAVCTGAREAAQAPSTS